MKILQASGFSQKIRIYALYLSAFPPAERKPFSTILSMQKQGRTDLWYFEEDRQFIGFATTINSSDLILLDYLAISPRKRGQGAGSRILQELQKLYFPKGLFVEIESTSHEADNQRERILRKQFYLANGMSQLHVTASVFGVDMELLGCNCELDFDAYKAFYKNHYSKWASDHILPN